MEKHDLQIHQEFSEYGRNAREWMRRCVLLLPEIDRRQIWKKRHFGSIYEYAAKLAGMSRATVEDGLRIMKKVEKLPALKELVESRGINRVRPIVALVNSENQDFWAEKAKQMSRHTLETYVQNYRSEFRTGPTNQPAKSTVSLELIPELAKRLEVAKKHPDFATRLEELLSILEAEESQNCPESVRGPSRHIPTHIAQHVKERTSELCSYPECSKIATSLHHTQRWGLEKIHDPARLHGLCTAHERLAHLGLIENEEVSPQEWSVRLQADPTADKRFIDQFVALYRPT